MIYSLKETVYKKISGIKQAPGAFSGVLEGVVSKHFWSRPFYPPSFRLVRGACDRHINLIVHACTSIEHTCAYFEMALNINFARPSSISPREISPREISPREEAAKSKLGQENAQCALEQTKRLKGSRSLCTSDI